ncbi:hypothetical protein, variant [Sphaeroforma arctica JP610]|uniref:PDZ GRASP-type domain-containing protein n=1 Tax=Sphaeroforma arctica JP610 TaxID=667725 RepID=A0A0L0FSY2_9EUKA|nr:hypothetical protein, variant [Sphaeroforma arctica JP610]KNC79900.1 hypothetical protein, variant [Sphaeroforma arctica JP610]|eukprot:XP_014153802.1 hypothetical protein, variant [Sphaeroforma arctica JP610]
MGGGQSTPVAEILDGSYEGYHVVKVHKDSPAELAGLVPLFDFIVSINEERLYKEDSTFVDQLNANIGVPIPIIVYNSRVRGVRELIIVPSNSWGGAGLLGASIRFCSFETATENVWHVLYQLVEAMNKKPVNLYVYDISTDSCREVTVTPDTDWGGDGSLGCSMGYGLLHRYASERVSLYCNL